MTSALRALKSSSYQEMTIVALSQRRIFCPGRLRIIDDQCLEYSSLYLEPESKAAPVSINNKLKWLGPYN